MGFKKIETRELPDIQSAGTLYEHNETGAQVLHLSNDDSNKAFTIGFKTPPYNDNGIAHILEHSVLNGSEKYPSKEPFVELIKGSLNTFVNAMTFSDKTIYPVASTNEKDFMHLMGVYLDAVFAPKIYEDNQILEQEGWHYHLEKKSDDLIYKGVVYNEMKGATASPERQLANHISKELYQNSIYSHESGGDPKAIPTLTQEEFLAFHQKYYHPSNSLTVLYGDVALEPVLNSLEEYFKGKGKLKEQVDLSFEVLPPEKEQVTETYSITEGDDPEGKDFLAAAWHVAEPNQMLDQYGLEVLEEILFGNNQSPLKKALLEADIGGDISGGTSSVGYPTAFNVIAKYSDAEKSNRFNEVIQETLEKLVKEGIDPELVAASLNKITFHTKEMVISEDNPRGVIYAINAYSTWLYGESPFDNLEFSTYLEKLAEEADKGYFESLIERKLLKNPNRTEVILTAEPGKSDRLEAANLLALQEYKDSLSEEEIDEIIDTTQALIKRQETPDRPEDLAKIPTLKRTDLTTEAEEYPLEISQAGEIPFYHASQFTSGIDYVSLYLEIKDADENELTALGYLSKLLGKLATKSYTAEELQRKIDLYTGGIHGSIQVFEDQKGRVKPYFVLQGKALEESLKELTELMKEILGHTVFEDRKERLKITQRLISNFEQTINFSAHTLAASRALSQVKASARVKELTGGIKQFDELKSIREELHAETGTATADQLSLLLNKLFNKNRMSILYVGSEERKQEVEKELSAVFSDMPKEKIGEAKILRPGTKQNEAFITAQDVNYVASGADAKNSFTFSGTDQVLATALRFDYLWNEIRVKGGAYGSLYFHRRNGSMALASYRDPNIQRTLDVYAGIPAYISRLELSEEELTKYMIGTMSPLEQPKSAFGKGATAFARLQNGLTAKDLVQLKKEILSTTQGKLSALSVDFKNALEDRTIIVIGNKTQIEQEKERFDAIHELY